MKKLTLVLTAFALVLGLSQCRKPNVQAYAGITKDITFSTNTGGDGSKATITNVLNELQYKWEESDVIHVYGSQSGDFTDGQYCGELKLISGTGEQEGTFKGVIENYPTNVGVSKIRFYYFGGGNRNATIDLSTQDGLIDNGISSLNKKIVASVEETLIEGSEYKDEKLEVQFSIIKFDLNQFAPTGTHNLVMTGTKNTKFYVGEDGKVVETAGTTTTLTGVSSTSDKYYVAVLPEDVTKLHFSGNGLVGTQGTTQTLKKNYFYTSDINGSSYVVAANTPVASPEVSTSICINCAFGVGGIVTASTAQNCEYGVVYAKTSDVANPADVMIGGDPKCVKEKAGNGEVTSSGLSYTIDITGFAEVAYYIRAYAIGENGAVVYGDVKTLDPSDKPVSLSWNGGGKQGASPKTFSVSSSTSVRFSQGNLQYIGSATEAYWKFSDHQFDLIGNNEQTMPTANINRDLFGWGTSGYHQESDSYNVNYNPYSTSKETSGNVNNPEGYGPSVNVTPEGPVGLTQSMGNISGSYYDWGVRNAIYNGGNTPAMWRTLTYDEWEYLVKREGKCGLATIAGCTKGLVILPDSWTDPSGVTFRPGETDGYETNEYTYVQWSAMESEGAVFLPAGGNISGETPGSDSFGKKGYYWASNYDDKNNKFAYHLYFDASLLGGKYSGDRYRRSLVRLVCDDTAK